jgi:hypothetical protein
MPASPLTAAILGNEPNIGLVDPALLQASSDVQLGQGMQQQGLSTAPAYPAQAIGRLAQALAGTYIRGEGLNDLARASAGTVEGLKGIFPQGSPLGDALRSPVPAVRMMAAQQASKAMLLNNEPYSLGPAEERHQQAGTGGVVTSGQPQSPEGKLVSDVVKARGNPAAAGALESSVTKAISTPEGVPYPPTNVLPTGEQTAAARQKLAAGLNAAREAGITSPTTTGLQPGPPPSMPEQIAGAKANIAAGEKLYGGASEALGKAIGEQIEAGGKNARDRMNALNAIDDAITAGGKGIVTGPLAERALKVREALNAVGLNFDWITKGMPESEIVSKMNAQLSSASSKAMTGRPTQFEFLAWMKNNPGLLTSPQGTHALIDILRQATRQDIDLGKLAQNKANWEHWGDTVDKYYSDPKNKIISPFSHKPIGTEVGPAAVGTAGPTHSPKEVADEMKRRGLIK